MKLLPVKSTGRAIDGLRSAISYMRRHPLLSGITFCLLLLTAVAEGVSMGMIIPVLATLTDEESSNVFSENIESAITTFGIEYSAQNLVTILLVALTFKFALQALQMYATRRLTATVSHEMRLASFNGIMSSSLSYAQKRKTGDTVASIFTSSQEAGAAIQNIFDIMIGCIFCIVYLILNFTISAELTSVALGLIAVITILLLPRFRYSLRIGREHKEQTDNLTTFLIDKISGIKSVKSFTLNNHFAGQFNGISEKFRTIAIRTQINRIISNILLEPLVSYLAIGLSIYAFTVLDMPLAVLGSFFIILYRTVPQLRLASTAWLEFVNRTAHFTHIKELTDNAVLSEPNDGTKQISRLDKGIRLQNVTFAHDASDAPTISDISFDIPAKGFVALVGESGGGKSTLIDLILRHHRPNSGKISVDGNDLQDLSINSWRGIVSVVDQDSHLFNDTIANNIRCGRLDASDEDIREAATLANASIFIDAMSQKYETVVGDRAVRVSGGQRQRIALARALVRKPQLVILDEATSALDSESERVVQEAISSLAQKVTIVAIAHRLSTVREADNILMIQNGRLIGQGSHDSLMSDCPEYRMYVEQQFLDHAQDAKISKD